MTVHTIAKDWKGIVVKPNESFQKALNVINEGGYQLCMVTDENGFLIGMVTDSDIRKALLKGCNLNDSISDVMNKMPLAVSKNLSESEAHQLMVINNFFHLPVVDIDGRLIGLHVAEQLHNPSEIEQALVIMAGGRGQRLMPLTKDCPKPMLPVKGKPMLHHIIERARSDGFKNIFISINYLGEQIIDYFGDGEKFDISIEYIKETEPLGTAGALASLPKEITNDHIVVTNGDVMTSVSYLDILNQCRREQSDGMMAVRNHEIQNPFGVVICKDMRILKLEEKPIYRSQVNAGIYTISPKLLTLLKKGVYCDMPSLFTQGIEKGFNLTIFPIHESWLDVGRVDDYERANSYKGKQVTDNLI